ncbi:hypothetical protein N7481_007520 [Penicillium waksmanii]|uniref:uncharacterized protein n=1 Tax=Penicillium waksmanii TaxID=69791 RepID=UPI0025496C0B|nr:uncharacterized protein N7481_007520 [Penicillium waksmanii]KAJ5980222.1 hypothetical protein N7481_007520 [Penicillium waksmanii]
MSTAQHLAFGEFQEQGALCQAWITNPNTPCPIGMSQLTSLSDLDEDSWNINTHPNGLPHSYTSVQMQDLNVPNQQYHLITAEMYSDGDTELSFKGRAGQGVLFIEDIMRSKGSTGPWISEISKVVYEDHFALDTLRHVFVTNISNEETKTFVNARLNLGRDEKVWESDAPQFQEILGTRIGKLVAYLLLGAFPRGTRKISRIAMWNTGHQVKCIQSRFDIEEIDA